MRNRTRREFSVSALGSGRRMRYNTEEASAPVFSVESLPAWQGRKISGTMPSRNKEGPTIMQNVSRFEASLLRLLYYFLRREPAERALPLVAARIKDPPSCLSRGCVRLVQDALAKGCTHLLAFRGGWRVEQHLRRDNQADRIAEGRLWTRTPPEQLGLTFSPHAMEFLLWITAAHPGDKDPSWTPKIQDLTPGDQLLLFFAHEGLREGRDESGHLELRRRQPFASHALCLLAYPEDFRDPPAGTPLDFAPWTNGLGACILEALQPELFQRWMQIESGKERITNPAEMLALGASQERVLSAFLDAVQKANRRDLARFLLRVGQHLLADTAHPGMWTGGLHTVGLRLTDRAAAYQSALTFVRQFGRLRGWATWARSVSRWDDDWHAANLWRHDWERYDGDTLYQRSQTVIRLLDPLRQGGAG